MSHLLSVPQKPSSVEESSEDSIIAELHAYREQYAAQFNYDWQLIYADMKRKEEQDEFFQQLRKNAQS